MAIRLPVIQVRRYGAETITHAHAHHQIVLALSGSLEMEVAGRAGCVTTTCAAVIPGGTTHSFAAGPGNAFLVLDLPERREAMGVDLHAPLWDETTRCPFVALDPAVEHLCRFLEADTRGGPIRGATAMHAAELVLRALADRLGVGTDRVLPASLRVAIGYIDAHLDEQIALSEVAAACAKSTGRLHALFRDHLATTPGHYITDRRMTRAAELLARTSLPIAEIALLVGYGDQAAFSRAFRRAAGSAPGEFRGNDPRQ